MIAATNLQVESAALICAIRWGESGWRPDDSRGPDYTILFGGKAHDPSTPHFNDGTPSKDGYFGFPEWGGANTSQGMTHAAGADQFEPDTWKDVCTRLFPPNSVPNFRNPADQDWGAWLLAKDVYKKVSGADLEGVLKAGVLSGIANALKGTWTSLSESTFSDRYKAALKVAQQEQAPQVPPAAIPPVVPAPVPVPVGSGDLAGTIESLEKVIAALQVKIDKLNVALTALKEAST